MTSWTGQEVGGRFQWIKGSVGKGSEREAAWSLRAQVCWGLWVGENVRFYSIDEGMSWKDFKLRPSKVPFSFEDHSCSQIRTAW